MPALALAGLLAAGVAVAGCQVDKSSSSSTNTSMNGESLYKRLGGEPAIRAVVDDFVAYAAPDPAVNFTRKGHPNEWQATDANVAKFKKHLVQFISKATGGPQTYEGRDMVTAHTGMGITNEEFNAIAGDLKKALDKNNVPSNLQDELIAVVETTRAQIVNK
jgi:hemoglobin